MDLAVGLAGGHEAGDAFLCLEGHLRLIVAPRSGPGPVLVVDHGEAPTAALDQRDDDPGWIGVEGLRHYDVVVPRKLKHCVADRRENSRTWHKPSTHFADADRVPL